MKRDSEESIRRHIRLSTARHQKLDQELIAEQRKLVPNNERVCELKRRKLFHKDRLTALEGALAKKLAPLPSADIIALPVAQPVPDIVMEPRLAATG